MSYKSLILFLFTVVCLFGKSFLFPQVCFAQEQEDFQSWNKFYTYFRINDEMRAHIDYGVRFGIPIQSFGRVHVRPALYVPFMRHYGLEVGVGFFRAWQDPLANTFEIRPYFGYYMHGPYWWIFRFKWRFRYEERFIYSDEVDELAPSLRLRFKGYVTIPFFNKRSVNKDWEGVFTYELFENIGDTELEEFVDQTRLEVGFGYRINDNFRLYLVYLKQNSKGIETHVIRFKFYTILGGLAKDKGDKPIRIR